MNYISISLYRKIIDHGIFEGLNRETFENLPTPIDAIDNLQAVPADHFFALHELLDEKLGPGFPVRVGQQMKMDDYGVLGLSWKTCSKAKEIFERSERYFKLLSDTYVFKVESEGDQSKILLFRDAHRRGVELSNEATFSATVVVLQAMTETELLPIELSLKHKSARDLTDYHKAFKCPIKFEQTQNYIAYRTKDLETRTAKADESINRFLIERVDEETKGIQISSNKILDDVEKIIRDALPSGIPAIVDVSEHLGMSGRTLTRRLSENGITFRDLIQKTQKEISIGLLKNSSRTIAEIAFQTGFSEQSAFNRAFKRWQGSSPLEFRKRG